jgi:ribonuclease HI
MTIFMCEVPIIWRRIFKLAKEVGVQTSTQGLKYGRLFGALMFSKENLFHRRVVGDQICPICTIEIESVLHILWECPAVVDVWSSGPKSLQKCSGGAVNLSSVLETLMRRCSSVDIELWAVMAKKLWLRRNSLVFGGGFISPNQLMREAIISIEDFKRANVPTEKENDFQAIPVPPVQWKAHSLGLYKINWDAAIDMKNRRMGVGIIARDYQGLVVAAHSLTLHGYTDSLVAEAWAALHAVDLAKESGLLDIILEGDALQVVNEINLAIHFFSKIGHFTDDIRSVLHSLRSFRIIHVKREANSAAHVLAKTAVFYVRDSIWLEETPPPVSDIVLRESLGP